MWTRLGPCAPSPAQIDLLRASLLTGEPAVEAWKKWKAHRPLAEVDKATRRLYPLLAHNLKQLGVVDPDWPTYQAEARHHFIRNHKALRQLELLLPSLGCRPVALKGLALGLTSYGSLRFRPMDDIDLWMEPERAAASLEWLRAQGWQMLAHEHVPGQPNFAVWTGFNLVGPDGQQIDLHGHLLHDRCLPAVTRALTETRIPLPEPWQADCLAPAEQLIHIISHGLRYTDPVALRWFADAYLVIKGGLDWERFCQLGQQFKLGWTLATGLRCLQEALEVAVPAGILERLEGSAGSWERREFATKMRPLDAWGALPQHLLRYPMLCRLQGSWPTPFGLLDYLRQLWGFEGYSEFCGVAKAHLQRARLWDKLHTRISNAISLRLLPLAPRLRPWASRLPGWRGSRTLRRVLLSGADPRYTVILTTPPVAVPAQAECELHMLLCRHDFLRGLWALKSFYRNAGLDASLVIHSDGSLDAPSLQALREHFPGCQISDNPEHEVVEQLNGFPRCQYFRRRHVMAHKFLDVLVRSQAAYIMTMDSDVLWFDRSPRLLDCVRQHTPFYVNSGFDSYVRSVSYLERHCGLAVARGCNAGMIGYPRQAFLDLPFIERCLTALMEVPAALLEQSRGFQDRGGSDPVESMEWWLMEQTLYALLFARRGDTLLLNRKPLADHKAHPFGLDGTRVQDAAVWHFLSDRAWNGFFPIGVEHLIASGFLDPR